MTEAPLFGRLGSAGLRLWEVRRRRRRDGMEGDLGIRGVAFCVVLCDFGVKQLEIPKTSEKCRKANL